MKGIFEIMTVEDRDEKGQKGIRLGISVKLGGHETICPISEVCKSYDALESEVRIIKENLENLLSRTKKAIFNESYPNAVTVLKSDMEAEEIWDILSSITDDKVFIDNFSGLEEGKRKEVADFILTRCNIFSGKGSVFSSRYNNESGLLE